MHVRIMYDIVLYGIYYTIFMNFIRSSTTDSSYLNIVINDILISHFCILFVILTYN